MLRPLPWAPARLGCLLLLAALLAPLAPALAQPPSDPPQAGAYLAAISYETWRDKRRAGREVPVKLYRPQGAPGHWPVIVKSPTAWATAATPWAIWPASSAPRATTWRPCSTTAAT